MMKMMRGLSGAIAMSKGYLRGNGIVAMAHALQYRFSFENHGMKMESENITRHFNRFRYDEYTALKSNPFKLTVLKKHEKKVYSSFFSKIEDEEYNRFFNVASRRKDKRCEELPERYDNFEYHS